MTTSMLAVCRATMVGLSATLLASAAVGQVVGNKGDAPPPTKGAKVTALAKQPAQATMALAVPQPEVLLVLIRLSLTALRNAVQTGNFTVLRDLGAPTFQAANSAAQLGNIFASLGARNIDLSPVVIVMPVVSEEPVITPDNLLRLVGYFPTTPEQIKFQMLFQPVDGQWRLYGMAVEVAPPVAAALVNDKHNTSATPRRRAKSAGEWTTTGNIQ